MKKAIRISFLLTLLAGAGAVFGLSQSQAIETKADKETCYPRSGSSGAILYVNGASTYFNTNEADLAIYCFNSETVHAWSDKVSYRVYGDMLRVMIPYNYGSSITWSKFIVCRYNPAMDPATNGFDGVYNKTADISFSSLMYAQNTINITGYNGDGSLNYIVNSNDYYGVRAENHMYLDLSGFTSWEEGNAKFALYFAYPNSTNENRWSQAYSKDGYYSSFCWKVNGQDNDHLYECIVPNIWTGSSRNIWNMVIAVRFDPAATTPNWDQKWNQTQNLSFNSLNNNANMIRIDDWNHGEFDNDNIISQESRLEFFGNYFLNTVTCSGTGATDATTKEMWDAVDYEYTHHLSRILQGVVWTCEPGEETTSLEKAVARYDYIVLYKKYAHDDFINRAESPNKTVYSSYSLPQLEGNAVWTLVLVASLLSIGAAGAAFLAINAKKKRNH